MDKIENIAIDIIDDPSNPMRTRMDDEKLNELSQSIKHNGLIQPITLIKIGSRYEVIAGHRRYLAVKLLKLPFIKAIIRELSDIEVDSVRVAENLYREDINPVDEARYIKIMIDKHKTEPSELSKITGKSETYLQARYDLLDFPIYLLNAIEQEHISLSAGQWLNKITDDRVRQEYTRFGILGGITAKRAEAWYRSWQLGSLPRDASTYIEPVYTYTGEIKPLLAECVICRNDDNIENMTMQYAHSECVRAVKDIQERNK